MKKFETYNSKVETGLSASDHQVAMKAYDTFTQLPEELKERLTFPGTEGRERNTRAGYFRKTQKDKKQIFHYTDKLRINLTNQGLPSEAKEFLTLAEEFYSVALSGLSKIIEDYHPLVHSVHFAKSGEQNHHLRFIKYDKTLPGQTIAAPHYDQSTLTIALCESEQGLRIGTGPNDVSDYIRDPDESVLFPGYGWLNLHKQLGISSEYVPAWHDAIQPIETTTTDEVGRLAIILFANPSYINTMPTADETSTPLDESLIDELILSGILSPGKLLTEV